MHDKKLKGYTWIWVIDIYIKGISYGKKKKGLVTTGTSFSKKEKKKKRRRRPS